GIRDFHVTGVQTCALPISGVSANPFLDPAFTIHWSLHTPDQIESAIEAAIADGQAAIDTIAALPLADVTFDNTFLALEQAGELLDRKSVVKGKKRSRADTT